LSKLNFRAFSELDAFLESSLPAISCFADTSALFAASYPFDNFSEASDSAFEALGAYNTQIFTNATVRAEFLENHRKVLIAESLIDLLEDLQGELTGALFEKLKSHRTSFRNKIEQNKSAKMEINQIRFFCDLLSQLESKYGNGWDLFCQHYLAPKLTPVWELVTDILNVNFISLREGKHPLIIAPVNWESAVLIMGNYGISSADAMILNLFLCSSIPLLLTADLKMAECALRESKGAKQIFIPDSLLR
jgi:hypothetical protein